MLTSLQNPLVKQIRKLHASKGRQEQQLFLLEGTHLLEEACLKDYPLMTVCCTPQWQQQHEQLWNKAAQLAQRAEIVSYEVLAAIATTVHPDGVVATAKTTATVSPQLAFAGVGLALETIQDPGNLGTIIRTAAAVGVSGLWLSADSADPEHPKVLRASSGAWFRLPIAVSADLLADVSRCREHNTQAIATSAGAQDTYWDIDYRRPTLILLGNEGAGLSEKLLAICDRQVRIPLSAGVESLNVAVSAALILYEAQRQRRFNP